MNEDFLDNAYLHARFDISELPPALRHAYNPALFEHAGKRWMFARTGAYRTSATHLLQVRGERLSYVCRLELPLPWWRRGDVIEDVRFFVHLGRPHISHTYSKTSRIAGWFRPQVRKIFLLNMAGKKGAASRLGLNKACMGYSLLDGALKITSTHVFPQYPNKNWQFFSMAGGLFAVHSIEPEHRVLRVERNRILEEWKTPTPNIYARRFGHLRGGTPPILFHGKYWSFFHSTRRDESNGYYFFALYTFECRPPFRIIEMTKAPIILPRDNSNDLDHQPNPAARDSFVIYPVGAVLEGAAVRVSYGINDTHMAQKLFHFDELQKLLIRAGDV